MQAPQQLDTRDAGQLVAELLRRRLGYVPEWLPSQDGPDAALVQIAARYWQAIIQRLNEAPTKNKLAFFSTLGIQLIPAQAARTPVVFRLADNVVDARLPANTRIAAAPPPESNDQIIFETERATGIATAKLQEVVSLWPGRDQYIDHSAEFVAGNSFQPFQKKLLENTPHHIYVGHKVLLALAGKAQINVIFSLRTLSSEHLEIVWEYWDGKVWRQFKSMQPECDEKEAAKVDSTNGLQFSGQYTLETDCAETSELAVNGINSFWIRGRLDEPLPPNSAQILPDVESITIGTSIARPLDITLKRSTDRIGVRGVVPVQLTDESGAPLKGVRVGRGNTFEFTELEGMATAPASPFKIQAGDFEEEVDLDPPPRPDTHAVLSLSADGMKPDKAFADEQSVDVTKPFFPLGLQPQPGSAFYFTNQEIFSKPGASLQVYVQTAVTAQDELSDKRSKTVVLAATHFVPATPLAHTVSWEYWDGTDWTQLDKHTFRNEQDDVSPKDFTGVGLVANLTIPFDMAQTEVNGEQGLWMRVRLLSGAYGFRNTLDVLSGKEFAFVVPQPPSVAKFLLGYVWQQGPLNPEYVLTYNDFRYEDKTVAATLPGETFQPYKPVSDRTPTLYLGFNQKLPEDRLAILFDITEQIGETRGPALLWQYFDGFSWEDLAVADETNNLRLPGLVSFIGPDDSQELVRFGTARHWLRARLKEDGPPGAPAIKGLFPNAAHAIQHQTIVNEAIGTSTGRPDQTFSFTQIPVLDGEIIEVREVAGLRANVEWRIVSLEVLGDPGVVNELENLVAGEGTQTEIRKGDVRLTRDRTKRITEVWVRWRSRRHLLFSGPDDRDYAVDRAQGLLLFGDAINGKVPPVGADILAMQYRTGGGSAGNVEARKISQLLAPIGGIEEVFNPLPAGGGADGESAKQYEIRAPQTLRHRGRALLPADYETFAREASPAVGYARAIAGRDPAGRKAPGWVTLLIIPRSAEPRPMPSFGLREEVRQHIEANTAADLAAAHRIYVTAPTYLAIDIDTTVVPIDPAEAGLVEQRMVESMAAFFHPLTGGPEGQGWELGRDVFLSDVASVLERVAGVDYLKDLRLLLNSQLQGERVKVADERIVVGGEFRVNIVEA
ncbi:MAG TPA: putative baseplate assembly protein [Pyrinomonadaceae bacterium]|nr:putative baseplate assembly protein [Pyrinomonadaceae bacterium]